MGPALMKNSISSKSWQEIYHKYRHYAGELRELVRIKNTFGFTLGRYQVRQTGDVLDEQFDIAENHFRIWVDETDAMIVLLDAEINRRNKLIGVMG